MDNQKSKTKNNLPFLIGFVVFILIIGFVSYGYFHTLNEEPTVQIKQKTIGLAASKSLLSVPVLIAYEKGFFKAQGLDIELKEYSSGKLALKSMLMGENQIATAADMPIVFNGFKGSNFCIFTTFTTSYSFVKILANRDSGIKTAADLKDKKIGVNRGTSSHYHLASYMLFHQLSDEKLDLSHYPTNKLSEALLNKEVDAASLWEPYAQKTMVQHEKEVLELPRSDIYRTTFSLAGKKEWVESNLKTMELVIKALDQASEYIRSNPDLAKEVIAASFKLEKAAVDRLWDDYWFAISLDQALIFSWEDISRWAIRNGLTDKKEIPNFLEYICDAPIKNVKIDAYSIIR